MEESKPKNNVKVIIGGLIAIIAVVAIVLIVTNKPKDGEDNGDSNAAGNTVVEGARVTAAELEGSVSTEVRFGDYDAMSELAKTIQNGQATGQVVTIDGVVSHPGISYSITEKNADGSERIGTLFAIDDDIADNYPEDGERVKITAKVVEIDTLNFQLVTLKKFITKVEE